MIKKLLSLFVSTALIFSTSSISFAADNPQDAIANNKLIFQQMSGNILETNKQISDLNVKVDRLKGDISKNNIDIDKNNRAIDAEKIHMEQLLEEVNEKQEIANKRLRAMYINGYDQDFLMIMLSSHSFSDFLTNYDSIKSIVSYDKKVFDALTEKKKNLNESIHNLDVKSKQLQQLKDNNLETLKELNDDREKLQNLVVQFNNEKAAAALAIKENEEKLIAHSVSAIDSNSSTISDVRNALQTLNSLVSQLSTDSVKKKAKDYIDSGNKKLADLIAKAKASQNSQSVDSTNSDYKATYTMSATAYTGGDLTAIGLKPVRDPNNLSTIAVDPNVIPLGAKVYAPGYGYAIASDTGSAIKGNIIDLYMNSEDDCNSWGIRTVTLYIVAYPGEW